MFGETWIAIVSTLMALAVGGAAWTLLSVFGRRAVIASTDSAFEAERRAQLEEANGVYDRFQVLVRELSPWNQELYSQRQRDEIAQNLVIAGDPTPWQPEEYLAVKQLESVLAGSVVALIALTQINLLLSVVIGVVVAAIYHAIAISALTDKAARRKSSIRHRLPYVVDLMALMIEAGATFLDSLDTAVRENRDSPLGQELSKVRRQIAGGLPRSDALRALQNRLRDDDVRELVFAINKGEELGTPLASILRTQSDQMRLKRSQWIEKAAAEAHVKITFPGLIVMIACALVVLGPIVLPAVMEIMSS